MSIRARTCRPSVRAAAATSAPSAGMMTPSAGNRFQSTRHQAVLYWFWPANGVTYNQREAAGAATVLGAHIASSSESARAGRHLRFDPWCQRGARTTRSSQTAS